MGKPSIYRQLSIDMFVYQRVTSYTSEFQRNSAQRRATIPNEEVQGKVFRSCRISP